MGIVRTGLTEQCACRTISLTNAKSSTLDAERDGATRSEDTVEAFETTATSRAAAQATQTSSSCAGGSGCTCVSAVVVRRDLARIVCSRGHLLVWLVLALFTAHSTLEQRLGDFRKPRGNWMMVVRPCTRLTGGCCCALSVSTRLIMPSTTTHLKLYGPPCCPGG